MITVYGPNGETKKINARSVVEWLGDNPGWSLDNPKTPVVDEADDSLGGPHGTFERAVTAGSTSSQTYQVVHRPGSSSWNNQTIYINRSNRGENDWYNCANVRSTFRIMEIAV